MGKYTFYCTICAGPLYEWEHRKLSMVQRGEDPSLCFEDICDCGAGANDGDEENEEHESYCANWRGYWGDTVSEEDIAWLGKSRMLRMPNGEDAVDAMLQPDDGSPCYLTPIGSYDPYEGLCIPGVDRGLWANQDGFLMHDACWEMLRLVHKTMRPMQRPLDPRHVYLTMLSKLNDEMDEYIYWDDDRLYGGTTEFAEQEWRPMPGYEWLVADPFGKLDFSEVISQSTGLDPGSLNGHAGTTTTGSVSLDPFSSLPIEVHHIILQLLPTQSLLNLFLSSRAFRAASTCLPPAFWRSRIHVDTPWIEGTALYESISGQGHRVDYKFLLHLLKSTSAVPPNGENSQQERYLSLKNRRRIWTCCEAILDIMEQGKKEAGSVSGEMEALTNTRVTRICQPKARERSKLVESETYFCPTTVAPRPSIRSLAVYFSPQASIVGIEWQLEDESSGRLFGHRAAGMQSVALPCDLVIIGILLSLGSASTNTSYRSACGFGLLSEDSPLQPRIKLGRWTDDDLVHVFRPANSQPNTTIVGITGQSSETQITKFGILTADLETKLPPTAAPLSTNTDIYTRWYYPQIPHPNENTYVRHGITDFPFGSLSPLDPPILENPAQYLDLEGRQIASVTAFYPLGPKKEFGGFKFTFADGDCQVVGSEENHESVPEGESVAFDVEAKEGVTKIICYFDSNVNRTNPSRFHGVEFCTTKNRKLGLGWLDAWNEDYRRDSYVRNREKVVGLHFGIKIPVIESIGLIVA